jgi:hypothetical protein
MVNFVEKTAHFGGFLFCVRYGVGKPLPLLYSEMVEAGESGKGVAQVLGRF